MLRRPFRPALLAAALLVSSSSLAAAGSLRIVVAPGGAHTFSPASISVNSGDHVVFVWAGSGHTATSGDPNTVTADGKFSSGAGFLSTGARFYWKTSTVGVQTYFCVPHAPSMAGSITVSPSGEDVADFRITEVEYAGAGGADRVQITNLGTATDFLDVWRMSYAAGVTQTMPATSLPVTAGAAVTLHLNAAGTNTSTDVFLAVPELGTSGSFALYVPNNTASSSSPASLTDAKQIVDYVEWGTPGQAAPPNEATAVSAGLWSAGTAVNTDALIPGGVGYSISFCGTRADHGASFWQISRPNFGSGAQCTTPTRNPTWGRIKALYR